MTATPVEPPNQPASDGDQPRRKARVYDLDAVEGGRDAAKSQATEPTDPAPHRPRERDQARTRAQQAPDDTLDAVTPRPATETLVSKGLRWSTLFLGAIASALLLSTGLWVYNFVAEALKRQDWVGWTTLGLISLALLALVVIIGREVLGFIRVGRLTTLRRELEEARTGGDPKAERKAVERLLRHLDGRPDLEAARKRLREYARDVNDPGALLALADRELLGTIDGMARRAITHSAKRVFTVTAMAPFVFVSVFFVLIESLRLMTRLATLYGGRPGWLGGLRLARLVFGHVIATGAIGLTDDLVGQFLGQDLLRRLSRRLGEAAFNGAFTARMGASALEVIRPLPYIEAKPVRARDIVAEVLSRKGMGEAETKKTA